MRKSILRLTFCMGILLMSAAGGILWTHRAARLDLPNDDDFHTVGKSIGMIPASREIYAAGIGLVDQTLFYQAVVTPDGVAWLAQTPAPPPARPQPGLRQHINCYQARKGGFICSHPTTPGNSGRARQG